MKEITTEIIINAPAQKVWNTLMAFENHPNWNPFIAHIEGDKQVGGKLKVVLNSGKSKMTFKPVVQVNNPNVAFEWLGNLFFTGLFDGNHYFHIQPINDNQVKFIHGERFKGILVNMLMKQIGEQTLQNFIAMNKALKAECEK